MSDAIGFRADAVLGTCNGGFNHIRSVNLGWMSNIADDVTFEINVSYQVLDLSVFSSPQGQNAHGWLLSRSNTMSIVFYAKRA